MNILELDSYNLDDAVKFNNHLNPKLWDEREHLRPEVRERLLAIADDFRESLGVPDLDIQDITISGSNAAYTYTPNSDIDLHLVVDMPQDEVYRELFNAKKAQYNDEHNIHIGGADVELYVQDSAAPHISQGIYSVARNEWVRVPRRARSAVDDTSTRDKFEKVGHQIERAIKSQDVGRMTRLLAKIKKMRQTGLEAHGEFGPENLAFKMLRSQGVIQRLHDARTAARDAELSLREKAPAPRVTYGFRTPVMVETQEMSQELPSDEEILQDFVRFCVSELKIKNLPTIKLRRDPQWPVTHSTFGRYINEQNLLEVAWGARHIMDVLRTVAHELTHRHQHERDGERMDNTAGETGSPWENEANARAGVIMRDYARLHPEYFAVGQTQDLAEATGYIPTEAEANDPRFRMALTQDVRPGAIGRAANAFLLNTDAQGHPQQLRADGVVQRLAEGLTQFKQGLVESQDQILDELKMTPATLSRFADSKDSQGIRAGFEAELVFTGYADTGPDRSYDPWARDIDQILEFFGEGLGYYDRQEIRSSLEERYEYWNDTQSLEDFRNGDGLEYVRGERERDFDWPGEIREELTNSDYSEELIDAIMDVGKQGRRQADEDPHSARLYDVWESARQRVKQRFDELVQQSWDDRDSYYRSALEEFQDDWRGDESDWLESLGIERMSDAEEVLALDWPPREETGGFNEESAQLLADDLADTLGVTTMVSTRYQGGAGNGEMAKLAANRDDVTWIIEPDTSIEADSGDLPVEIVTPPMPLADCLTKIDEFFAWARKRGADTNDSTSIHMGVSLPETTDRGGADVDYVKLALFLGDQHVLEEFGRQSNAYCTSALKNLKKLSRDDTDRTQRVLALLKQGLAESASEALARSNWQVPNEGGRSDSRYSSINKRTGAGYIEFRSAGGPGYIKDADKIKTTLLRYAKSMKLASDPAAGREEYYKKFYKLISADSQATPGLELLARYQSGKLTLAEFKRQWAQTELKRHDDAKTDTGDRSYWQLYVLPTTPTPETMRELRRKAQPIRGYRAGPMTRERAESLFRDKMGGAIWDSYAQGQLELRDTQANTGTWRASDEHDATIAIFDAPSSIQAYNYAEEHYPATVNVEPYPPDAVKTAPPAKPELNARAKLAHRIAQRSAPWMWGTSNVPPGMSDSRPDGNWRIVYYQSNKPRPHVLYRFNADSAEDAVQTKRIWCDAADVSPGEVKLERLNNPPTTAAAPADEARAHYEIYSSGDPQQRTLINMYHATADEVRERIRQEEAGGEIRPGVLRVRTAPGEVDEGLAKTLATGAVAAGLALGGNAAAKEPPKPHAHRPAITATAPAQAKHHPAPAQAKQHTAPQKQQLAPAPQKQQLAPAPQVDRQTAYATLYRYAVASGMTNPHELAQFMAQCSAETGGFRHLGEIGNAARRARDYGNKLGNTTAKDALTYVGRGYIQLTGKTNYQEAGQALHGDPNYYLGPRAIRAAYPEEAAKIAVWFWRKNVVPRVKSFADTDAVTRAINGQHAHRAEIQKRQGMFTAFLDTIQTFMARNRLS